MVTRHPDYNPSIAIHPGNTLRDELEFLKISQVDLSARTGISEKHISQIIHGEAPITPETAIKFERVLGTPADFWNTKQKNYDLTVARLEEEEKLKQESKEGKKYKCFSDLVRLSAVRNVTNFLEQAEELLRFFRVDSLSFVPGVQGVAYRRSDGAFDEHALYAWLQCGEHQARQLTLAPFSEKELRNILPDIKSLIRSDGEFFTPLQELCARVGVAVVYTPYFAKTKVNGAVRWVGDNPLVQLNSRGAKRDRFWFTFLHEVGHILLHGKKDKFLEYDGADVTEKEEEANKFAADFLIPPSEYKKLLAKKTLTLPEAELFAKHVGVDLSVLVGRFAHDGLVSWRTAGRLCKPISLPDPRVVVPTT